MDSKKSQALALPIDKCLEGLPPVSAPPSARERVVGTRTRTRSYAFYGVPAPVLSDEGDVVWVSKADKDGIFHQLPSQSYSVYVPAVCSNHSIRSTFIDSDQFSFIPSNNYDIGAAVTIGKRKNMEDSLCVHGGFIGDEIDFVGVFDGHNGPDAAINAAKKLPRIIKDLVESGNSMNDALKNSFKMCHDELVADGVKSGTTATVVILTPERGYVAHVGDSRAIIAHNNRTISTITKDHRASFQEECNELIARGGKIQVVNGVNRVDGMIAITRALGDPHIPSLSHEPDVYTFELNEKFFSTAHYVVLACDGVWDFMSDMDVFCTLFPSKPFADAECAAMEIRGNAFSNSSDDNISVVVIDLNRKNEEKPFAQANPKSQFSQVQLSHSKSKRFSLPMTANKRADSPLKENGLVNSQTDVDERRIEKERGLEEILE